MPRAIVALGANLGEPRTALRKAAAALSGLAEGRFAAASVWQSEPLDCPPGSPVFLNSAVMFETDARPDGLLDELQRLEDEAGRVRGMANAPRTLDLDLIDFGGLVLDTRRLTLPHPRAGARAFVLAPVAEMVPGYVLPGTLVDVSTLLAAADTSGLIRLGPL